MPVQKQKIEFKGDVEKEAETRLDEIFGGDDEEDKT